jgi:hypothetical protein
VIIKDDEIERIGQSEFHEILESCCRDPGCQQSNHPNEMKSFDELNLAFGICHLPFAICHLPFAILRYKEIETVPNHREGTRMPNPANSNSNSRL